MVETDAHTTPDAQPSLAELAEQWDALAKGLFLGIRGHLDHLSAPDRCGGRLEAQRQNPRVARAEALAAQLVAELGYLRGDGVMGQAMETIAGDLVGEAQRCVPGGVRGEQVDVRA